MSEGPLLNLNPAIDHVSRSPVNRSPKQSALEAIIDSVLATNEKNIAEYRAGKDKAFNALVGQVMKASQGKANPAQVNALLKSKLG